MKQIEVQIAPLRISKAYQGRRFKTKQYLAWQKDFHALVGKHKPIKGKLSLIAEFYIKNDKVSDIDNFFKATLDTMKDAGIIEDDRFIYELHAYKYKSDKEFIRLTISEI